MPDWSWLLLAALLGAVTALTIPIFLFIYILKPSNKKVKSDEKFDHHVILPAEILDLLTRGTGKTAEGALNALLQFIFQQSTADTRWIRRRMANELAELLTKTSGKIFESLTLHSLEIGSEFPVINNLQLLNGDMEEDGDRLNSLDLQFDLSYDGSFRIDVDAVMLLGKSANISITVASISGNVRLMFRRNPYTHWALAFELPPKVDLRVRGRFQGRQLKPRLAAMIAAHIRRALAQKHTLPNYKIRYKPFFPKTEPGSMENEGGPTPHGRLILRLVELTRLHYPEVHDRVGAVRASLAIDSHSWVSLSNGVLVLDVVLPVVTGSLGLVCCQSVGEVLVDTVIPMSPAYRADLRRDDVVLAVDNKMVFNVAQVGKLLRAVEHRAVTVRLRRGGSVPVMRRDELTVGEAKKSRSNFTFRRVSEVMEGVRFQGMKAATSRTNLQDTEISSKSSDNLTEDPSLQKPKVEIKKCNEQLPSGPSSFGLRKRRCSVENKSSDSSTGSTPSTSGASTPHRHATAALNKARHADIPVIKTNDSESYESDTKSVNVEDKEEEVDLAYVAGGGGPRQMEHIEICQMFWTKKAQLKSIVSINEETEFKLNENHKYLNLNVWATFPGEKNEVLLGYLNIPLAAMLAECQFSTVRHHTKRYQLLPPDVEIKFSKTHKLAGHNGFEPCLCFGDALVWWEWRGAMLTRKSTRACTHEPLRLPPRPPSAITAHEFVRTQFHRSTQCDFCNKKIWLKDAMQCRNCGQSCHKKCVTKCQEASVCMPKHIRSGGCSPPELITTEADSIMDPDSDDEPERKDSLDVNEEGMGPMSALVAGLRRAGSAHSLAAPKSCAASARSLPPSPIHTPRKQSLEPAGNPFSGCGATWLRSGNVTEMLQPALHSALPPDALLAAARDSAPELAGTLSLQQIHDMLSAVREELSSEQAESGAGSGEERACALTALMLHCCAAAQMAQQGSDAAPATD